MKAEIRQNKMAKRVDKFNNSAKCEQRKEERRGGGGGTKRQRQSQANFR